MRACVKGGGSRPANLHPGKHVARAGLSAPDEVRSTCSLTVGAHLVGHSTTFARIGAQLGNDDAGSQLDQPTNAVFGMVWFIGSLALGAAYDYSMWAVVLVSVALQVLGLPFLAAARSTIATKETFA